ncbi:hypothetical protein [Croceibacter atlanticus]|jgi:hypothetical protein|uniref:hypothetical protein n=1 Tax=Croceibacter atlanticus TaxID=313588 RepID=UPI0002D42849|nr:hypothetical protein [Croceibacter atlanticus]
MAHCRDCRHPDIFGSDGRCEACWGSGEDGIKSLVDGAISAVTGLDHEKADCEVCSGTGQCQTCGGTGYVKDMPDEDDIEVDSNIATNYDSYSSDDYDYSDYDYGSTTSSSTYSSPRRKTSSSQSGYIIPIIILCVLCYGGWYLYDNVSQKNERKRHYQELQQGQNNINRQVYVNKNNINIYSGTRTPNSLLNTQVIDKLNYKNQVTAKYSILGTNWVYVDYIKGGQRNVGYVRQSDIAYDKHFDRTYNGNIYFRFSYGKYHTLDSQTKQSLDATFKKISKYNDPIIVEIANYENTGATINYLYSSIRPFAKKYDITNIKHRFLRQNKNRKERTNYFIVRTNK